MALINLSNGTSISRNCASKIHSLCIDGFMYSGGCKCACGCEIGLPGSLMNARRSSECTRGNHVGCVKYSGAPCPCECHTKNFTGASTLCTQFIVSDARHTANSRECNLRFENAVTGNNACKCQCHVVVPSPILTINAGSPYPIQTTNAGNLLTNPTSPFYAGSVVKKLTIAEIELKYRVGGLSKYWSSNCIGFTFPEYGLNVNTNHSCALKNTCGCGCHQNANTFQASIQVPVSNNPKLDYKGAVARLAPIAEEIASQIFLGEKVQFSFIGETVREALFGGLVNKYIVGCTEDDSRLLRFVNELHKDKLVNGQFVVTTKFGDIKFLLVTNWAKPNEDYPENYWNCNFFSYNLSGGISENSRSCKTLIDNKVLQLEPNAVSGIKDPQAVLEAGVKLATQHGWSFDQSSIDKLAELIKKNQPLENTHELVIGFRSYNLAPANIYGTQNIGYKLKGQHEGWESESKSVDCPDYKQHLIDVPADHRGRGTGNNGGGYHDCGIYVYKDPSECLFHYGVSNTENQAMALVVCWGVIGEFEHGYRVQHCRIQRLWIWDKDKRLTDNYKIDEIYSGAKFSHFLTDSEVMQFMDRVDSDATPIN